MPTLQTKLRAFEYLINLLKYLNKTVDDSPVSIRSLYNKPYVLIGNYLIKSNKGKFDIYVWNTDIKQPELRGSYYETYAEEGTPSSNITYATGFNSENWLEVITNKEKKDEKK